MTHHIIVSVDESLYKNFAKLIRGERKNFLCPDEGSVFTLIKFKVLSKPGFSNYLYLGDNASSTWGFHDGNGYFLVVSVE